MSGDTYTSLISGGHGTEAAAVADLAHQAAEAEVLEAGEVVSIHVPAGATHIVEDLERFLPEPRRPRGTAQFHTAESFARYVNAHKQAETALYADVRDARVIAVFNDDNGAEGGWRDWRGVLTLRRTEEWTAWVSRSGKLLTQVAFAELVEYRLIDLVDPAGADLLELAQTLQVNTAVNFRSSTRLRDGQVQLRYEETNEARAGTAGELTVPATFTLRLAPFEGFAAYDVTARLRYRVSGGDLSIGFVLDRPNDIVETAFVDVLGAVQSDTDIEPFHGTPAGSPATSPAI